MKLQIIRKVKATDDAISLYFRKRGVLSSYKPGQHALLSIRINGEIFRRTYSFHTSPTTDENVGITVRAVEGGLVSNYFQTLDGTADIYLDGIAGDFVVEAKEENDRHLMMFAAGSGITPLMAMLKTILHHEPKSRISLVYSNRNLRTIIFRAELATLAKLFPGRLTVYHVLTQETNPITDTPVFYQGRLSKIIIKKILKMMVTEENDRTEYYLCGPYAFMQIVEDMIRAVNPDNKRIYKEHFYIPDQHAEFNFSDLQARNVILQMPDEEKRLLIPAGNSVLQAALDCGINLPHSCKEGQCGSCTALLLSGEIRLRRNHILTDDEVKAGKILLCQAFPMSDGVAIKPRL